jgi:hypothetical protein
MFFSLIDLFIQLTNGVLGVYFCPSTHAHPGQCVETLGDDRTTETSGGRVDRCTASVQIRRVRGLLYNECCGYAVCVCL